MGEINCCLGKNDNNSTFNFQNEIKKIEDNENENNFESINTHNTPNILNTMRIFNTNHFL